MNMLKAALSAAHLIREDAFDNSSLAVGLARHNATRMGGSLITTVRNGCVMPQRLVSDV